MKSDAVSELLPLTFVGAVGAVRVFVFDQHHVRKLEQEDLNMKPTARPPVDVTLNEAAKQTGTDALIRHLP